MDWESWQGMEFLFVYVVPNPMNQSNLDKVEEQFCNALGFSGHIE